MSEGFSEHAPRALAQRFLERCRAPMLLQKIGKGLTSQLLETLLAVARKPLKREPSLVIEPDPLPLHCHFFASPRRFCPAEASQPDRAFAACRSGRSK